MRPALQQTVLEWTQEWKREGYEEGLKLGRAAVRREGTMGLLIHLMDLKFGPLRPEHRAYLEAAEEERLLEWGERLLDARSLDEVFAE